MESILRRITSLLDHTAACFFAIAIVINIANIAGRYLFQAPVFWAEEVTTILVIWSICLLSFRLTTQGEHLATEILRSFLKPEAQRALLFVVNAFVLVVATWLAWQSYLVTQLVAEYGQTTIAAEIPKVYVNSSILVCFTLASIGSLIRLILLLDRGQPLPGAESLETAELTNETGSTR